jgi:hypothetical protein
MTETVTFEKPRGKPKGKYLQFVLYVYNQLKNINKKIDKINKYIEEQKLKEMAQSCFSKKDDPDDYFI